MPSKAAVAITIFFFLYLAVLLGPPRYDSSSSWFAIVDKHKRLEQLGSPKVITVGGSNVALGIDSANIERSLKLPVVNMAFTVTLGLRYMLEEIKDRIGPGDLVVLMPEYDFFATLNTLMLSQMDPAT